MTDRRQQLFDAVLDAPHDEAPRIAFAGWLDAQGDPQGEFIRLQLAARRAKLGRGPGPWDVWLVESPALGLRPKARARDSGLDSFRCAEIIPSRNSTGHFVPWSPGPR